MIPPIREGNIGQPGIEKDPHGDPVGKDPRQIDQAELRAAGHVPMPVLKAIRAKCIDCCSGSTGEVRNCIVTSCPLWPYRMDSNPWRSKKVLSPEHRERLIAAKKPRNNREFSSAGEEDAPSLPRRSMHAGLTKALRVDQPLFDTTPGDHIASPADRGRTLGKGPGGTCRRASAR